MRTFFIQATFAVLVINVASYFYLPEVLWSLIIFGPLILLGLYDITQKSHSILRNFPVLGHIRFLLEEIRPEIYQYFVESDTSGRPFSREQRSVVYARAKNARDTVPFGTVDDVLRKKFGENVTIKKFEKTKGWLAKRLSSENSVDQLMNIIEERSIWQRYGF